MSIRIGKISILTMGRRLKKYILLMTLLIFSVFSVIGSAGAMEFDFGHDASLGFDVTVTYGCGIRVSDRDDGKLPENNQSPGHLNDYQQALNQDDANRNFDQWDLINNKITVLADIDLRYKDSGLFVRPKAFYDQVYMSNNANDSPDTNNPYRSGLISESDHWQEEIEDIHGKNAEILDLFGYTNFQLADLDIDIRVGRQMISWGESLLIIGGISSAQNPMDVAAATAVGTEVKEMFLPTETVYLQMGITPDLSLSGYYQWKWQKTRVMEGGTFFAQGDMPDEIAADMLGPDFGTWPDQDPNRFQLVPRGNDNEARNHGQYGIRLMYVLPWLDATEVGLYYINYHDKNPIFILDTDPVNYHFDFTEDIKLYGFSVSSIVGPVNVSGEFSYRQGVVFRIMKYQPVPTPVGVEVIEVPAHKDADYWQTQVSAIWTTPLRFFADGFTFTGEVACGEQVGSKMSADLPDWLAALPGGGGNEFSWTYSCMCMFDWYQVVGGLDLGLNLANSDVMQNRNFAGMDEGTASFSVGGDFVYKTVYKGSLVYENRYNRNIYRDRDTIALTLSYSF